MHSLGKYNPSIKEKSRMEIQEMYAALRLLTSKLIEIHRQIILAKEHGDETTDLVYDFASTRSELSKLSTSLQESI